MPETTPRQIIAVVGGATAGAEAAALFAERGAEVVVFEQNARPYGKIEDGLPRWHDKLRRKEYDLINDKLSRPRIHFVPRTKIGRDIDFRELATDWGFTAVVLALGAWRDRPLPIDGAERYVDRGLVYQNPLIHWFNHYPEVDYDGPRYEIPDGAVVIGGGLASIDVIKVLQIEVTRRALRQRDIEVDALQLEHEGIPAVLAAYGTDWHSLGLKPATLFYRRRVEDMPLSDIPDDVEAQRRRKLEAVRRRILEKAMQRYCFAIQAQRVPVGLLVEGKRLAGLRFQHTAVEAGRATLIEGAYDDVRAPLVVSSIGSIPEPITGIRQAGVFYRFTDPELGRLEGYDSVFGIGNVVTGKGNIMVSRRHSIEVTTQVIEQFLGLSADHHQGEEQLLALAAARADEAAARVAAVVGRRPSLSPQQAEKVMQRVRTRQQAVGYSGNYMQWIEQVTPAGS
ncbi:MAG: hypothetical protein HY270_05320 [Deltaproteobacteria bacterium]|nr:hypothetical protein [Deltaproteobacteria bacterium]